MQIGKPYAINEKGRCIINEDSIFPQKNKANETNRFFVICDGIGGHENGEIASKSVCDSFAEFLETVPPNNFNENIFNGALNYAFDELDKKQDSCKTRKKMGTTLAMLYLNDNQAFMAHIGDSRIYHLRKNRNGKVNILYKSSDHSLVNELLKAEVITKEEADNYPKKNMITRAMQPYLEKRHKAEIRIKGDIKAGDRFFLCSDGVYESLTDEQLCAIADNADDETMMNIIQTLCEEHSRDNFSAWLVTVIEGINPSEEPEEKTCINFPHHGEKKKSKKRGLITGIVVATISIVIYLFFIFQILYNK